MCFGTLLLVIMPERVSSLVVRLTAGLGIWWVMFLANSTTVRSHTAAHPGRGWGTLLTCLVFSLTLFSILTTLAQLPDDAIYYTLGILLLILSGLQFYLLSRVLNRYATRPVPFFREEDDQ